MFVCLLRFRRQTIQCHLKEISVGHCVVCLLRFKRYSEYGKSLVSFDNHCDFCLLRFIGFTLWQSVTIVLSVFFEEDRFFDLISLISVGHCVVCLLRFTDSGYLLWYLLAIVLSVFFDLHILVMSLEDCCPLCCLNIKSNLRFWLYSLSITRIWPMCCLSSSIYTFWIYQETFVSVGHCVVCLLRFTDSGYLNGNRCCLSSSIYEFWLSHWQHIPKIFQEICSLYQRDSLLRFTYSGYFFGICWPLCCLSSSIYRQCWLSLWYLLAIMLSVFFDLHILVFLWYLLDIGLSVFFELRILAISLYLFAIGLFFDLRILVISLKSVGHCVVCLLRFNLWYLLAIVLCIFSMLANCVVGFFD